MSSKLKFFKADPIVSERQAMGSAVDLFLHYYSRLVKTFTLALLSHHNSITQRWKSPVAGLPSSNDEWNRRGVNE